MWKNKGANFARKSPCNFFLSSSQHKARECMLKLLKNKHFSIYSSRKSFKWDSSIKSCPLFDIFFSCSSFILSEIFKEERESKILSIRRSRLYKKQCKILSHLCAGVVVCVFVLRCKLQIAYRRERERARDSWTRKFALEKFSQTLVALLYSLAIFMR